MIHYSAQRATQRTSFAPGAGNDNDKLMSPNRITHNIENVNVLGSYVFS